MSDLENINQPMIAIDYRLDKHKLYLEVSDNGKGISTETKEKIFVPFFSTKKEGSGIGLTITRNIMKMHQGKSSFNSF